MDVQVDTSKLTSLFGDLEYALGSSGQRADAAEIVEDESRRLLVEIVKDTPPQTKAIGERAVTRDINSLFTGATPRLIDAVVAKHGTQNVDHWITDKDKRKTHILWQRIDPRGDNMAQAHAAARDRNGRVPRMKQGAPGERRARIAVPQDAKAAYREKVKARVGMWKASWAATAMLLGVSSVVGWIKRHIAGGDARNAVHDLSGLNNGAFPRVTFGSTAPGVGKQRGIIQNAVRIRAEAIKRRIRLAASGYARDIAQGMKITRKERRSGRGGRYSIG